MMNTVTRSSHPNEGPLRGGSLRKFRYFRLYRLYREFSLRKILTGANRLYAITPRFGQVGQACGAIADQRKRLARRAGRVTQGWIAPEVINDWLNDAAKLGRRPDMIADKPNDLCRAACVSAAAAHFFPALCPDAKFRRASHRDLGR